MPAVKLNHPAPLRLLAILLLGCGFLSGCSLVPETRTRDSLHNPFPQLKRVAVLPFFNQSEHPNLDGEEVARAYYGALQSIPGFEVLPVGVTAMQWRGYSAQFGEPRTGTDFQKLAQMMDVEAIVVGSVTDFESYYPPRMAMTVHWYAASEGFHPIPAGYGLPWGTEAEEKIPARIVREAEFELARNQLKTQNPMAQPIPMKVNSVKTSLPTNPDSPNNPTSLANETSEEELWDEATELNPLRRVQYEEAVAEHQVLTPMIAPDGSEWVPSPLQANDPQHEWVEGEMVDGQFVECDLFGSAPLPADWPEPTDLIPDPPSPTPPVLVRQHEPVLSHTRLYRGDDPYFTGRLSDYVETGDDARGMSWQGYIKRSDDFIRFCCHLHIVEMLEARGGRDPSDLILRWPVSRY